MRLILDKPRTETKKIIAEKDGSVIVTVETNVTEREIFEDREAIITRLHITYLNVLDQMKEFQAQWDANPTAAFWQSAAEGLNAGGAEWLSDQAELFESKTWVSLGEKLQNAAGTTVDRLATYSKGKYQVLQKEINKYVDNPDDTLYNWAWWQSSILKVSDELAVQHVQIANTVKSSIVVAADSVMAKADMAKKMYIHRDALLGLPELIASADVNGVQRFIDTVLMDIDPELAAAIKHDPNLYAALEVIADHDSALTYLTYVQMILEAVPPNFYAYVAGRGGAYVMIEIATLAVVALLSAGSAAAARVATLIARFATAGAKVSTVGKRIKRAKHAIDALVRALEDMIAAVSDLHALGSKLRVARSKPHVIKGRTKSTLQARREIEERKKKCRFCGSIKHPTPRIFPGTIRYE